MTRLTAATLPKLTAAVAVPRYDRRQVTTGIVHISVGNFHRSHQAMYIDALMNSGAAMDWARLCANASDRIPKFLFPVIRRQLAAGQSVTRSAAVVASWARYAEGTDESGEPHAIIDAIAPRLQAAARRQRRHPAAFLEDNRAVFGDLAGEPRFTQVYSSILTALHEHGVRRTLADLDHYATPAAAGRTPAGPERKSP